MAFSFLAISGSRRNGEDDLGTIAILANGMRYQ